MELTNTESLNILNNFVNELAKHTKDNKVTDNPKWINIQSNGNCFVGTCSRCKYNVYGRKPNDIKLPKTCPECFAIMESEVCF